MTLFRIEFRTESWWLSEIRYRAIVHAERVKEVDSERDDLLLLFFCSSSFWLSSHMKQWAAWSHHLQFLHVLSKCLDAQIHWEKKQRSEFIQQVIQTAVFTLSQDWMRTALTYNEWYDLSWYIWIALITYQTFCSERVSNCTLKIEWISSVICELFSTVRMLYEPELTIAALTRLNETRVLSYNVSQ